MNKGRKFDEKEAYNKDLTAKARLHYLENERADINMSGTSMGSGVNMCVSQVGKHMKGNSGLKMSADLKYMPVMDREKDAMKKGDM